MMPPDPSDDNRKVALRNQIDENLRRVYEAASREEIPERLLLLLQQLRESTTGGVARPQDTSVPPATSVVTAVLSTVAAPAATMAGSAQSASPLLASPRKAEDIA